MKGEVSEIYYIVGFELDCSSNHINPLATEQDACNQIGGYQHSYSEYAGEYSG